jgi:hypothetical protein
VVGVIGRIAVADKLVNLERARRAVLPVVLSVLPPVASGGKYKPAQYHNKHHHAHKEHPVEAARWPGFLMDDDTPVVSLDDLIALAVCPADRAAWRPRLVVSIVVIFSLDDWLG